jgi:hypothetical protein
MCKDCSCDNQEKIQYESSVDPAVTNNNVVTISSIKGN